MEKNTLLGFLLVLLLGLASCECGLECKNKRGFMQVYLYNYPNGADSGIRVMAYNANTNELVDSLVYTDLSSFTDSRGSGVMFTTFVMDSMRYSFFYRNQPSPFLFLSDVRFKTDYCKSCGKKYPIDVLDQINTVTNYTVEHSYDALYLY